MYLLRWYFYFRYKERAVFRSLLRVVGCGCFAFVPNKRIKVVNLFHYIQYSINKSICTLQKYFGTLQLFLKSTLQNSLIKQDIEKALSVKDSAYFVLYRVLSNNFFGK